MSFYIGLMSGTSMDGIDAALVAFENDKCVVHKTATSAYPAPLLEQLAVSIKPDVRLTLHEFATLNINVGRAFANAANELIAAGDVPRDRIKAIGTHGQTLRHSPDSEPPYTLQIGDPATIATRCGLTTVADFRSLDVAAGGQGAPLVPPFHEAFFRNTHTTTIVLNIGGIANVTVLPADPQALISGFDTGPGNCLLDEWIARHRGETYDSDGEWAATGSVSAALLESLMRDPYITRPPGKSTGREYFNLALVDEHLGSATMDGLAPEDVQATLGAFTVESIADGIRKTGIHDGRMLVCGGGVRNGWLMARLRKRLAGMSVESVASVGSDPDYIEASAFAWLARQRLLETPVRLTTTGGRVDRRILGAVYLPGEA